MDGIDSEHLMALARQKTRESRSVLASTMADLFDGQNGTLTDRERALMFEIIHRIVVDAERALRQSMSERLSTLEDAPRDLVRLLANDEIEVAYPILTNSLTRPHASYQVLG